MHTKVCIYKNNALTYISFYLFKMQTHTRKYKCKHSYLILHQNTFTYFSWQHKVFFCLLTPQSLIHILLKGKKYASVL